MDGRQIQVFQPTGADAVRSALAAAPRPASLQGLTIGLHANGKLNSEELLAYLGDLLAEQHAVQIGRRGRKGTPGTPIESDLLQSFAGCQAVIQAVGD